MRNSPRRASAMIVSGVLAVLGASLVGDVACRAIEIPFREILLGANAPSHLQESDSAQRLFVRWETRFWELYRTDRKGTSQDYHQFDSRVSALVKSGWLLHGFEVRWNALSLDNANVFTDADRMSGGRMLASGGLLLGIDGVPGHIPGRPRVRALGALGWDVGVEASLEATLAWERRAFVSVKALTAAADVNIDEEMNGHRYPFHFPIRTETFEGESSIATKRFQFAAFGGFEVSHGDGTDSDSFGNALYYRRISYGTSTRYGIELLPGDAFILQRLDPASSFPGYSLTFAATAGNGDLGMERDGVRYLHLENAEVGSTSLRFDFIPLGSAYCSAGWQRLRIEHDGDSYFDVWPFSIWDVFSARRYRLGHVDGRIDIWHLGGGCMIRRKHFDVALGTELAYLDDSFSLRWYERKDILYPFVFTYVAHDETPAIRYRYALQVKPVLSIRATSRLTVTLSGSGIAPFGREQDGEEATSPASPGGQSQEKGSNRGGLFGTIVLTYVL